MPITVSKKGLILPNCMFSQTFTPTCQYFYTDISVISVTFRNSDWQHCAAICICVIWYICISHIWTQIDIFAFHHWLFVKVWAQQRWEEALLQLAPHLFAGDPITITASNNLPVNRNTIKVCLKQAVLNKCFTIISSLWICKGWPNQVYILHLRNVCDLISDWVLGVLRGSFIKWIVEVVVVFTL